MKNNKTIGMIGIGGSGMRGLAYLLAQAGNNVIGTDDQYQDLIQELKNEPFDLIDEQSFATVIKKCEMVIYTDAIAKDNPLITTTKEQGITCLSYSQALGHLSQNYTTIAIAGTHGKSSTTAIISHILIKSELDPTVVIGAGVPEWDNRHARDGKGEYMVVEADEYRDHFLNLQPKYIVITSIEHDHPDYFPTLEDVLKSFQIFIDSIEPTGKIIVLQSVVNKHKSLKWPDSTVIVEDKLAKDIKVGIPGEHMRLNALLTLTLADQIGIKQELALSTIESFKGIKRRFEILGKYNGMEIVSDYGHHPTEIKETLKAARGKYDGKKILVIFEGHTTDRLEQYKDQFTEALDKADGLVIAPAYLPKGREGETTVTDTILDYIEREVKTEVIRMKNYDELASILENQATNYDITLAFSAGALDGKLRAVIQRKKMSEKTDK